jgi:hypothetical protein
MIVPGSVRVEDLKIISHLELAASRFDRAFLVLHMGSIVYGWDRVDGWQLTADPDASEREAQRNRMNKLVFETIPRHHREHEY